METVAIKLIGIIGQFDSRFSVRLRRNLRCADDPRSALESCDEGKGESSIIYCRPSLIVGFLSAISRPDFCQFSKTCTLHVILMLHAASYSLNLYDVPHFKSFSCSILSLISITLTLQSLRRFLMTFFHVSQIFVITNRIETVKESKTVLVRVELRLVVILQHWF